MKRTYKYALSAVLATVLVAPALAQDNFPDVPQNHWVYEGLAQLKKDGILVGYPDGLFHGARPASRYELAAAIHAAYVALKNAQDGLDTQVKALEEKVDKGMLSPADLENLKSSISSLQSDVSSMKGWGDDIAFLKKAADKFEKELAGLGADVDGMKKALQSLGDRVTALEKAKLPVNIGGQFDFWMTNGYSTSDEYGITVQGRPTGMGYGNYYSSPVGGTRDMAVFHEAALTLSSTNETGPKWSGTFVWSNMWGSSGDFGDPMDSQSDPSANTWRFGEGPETVYIQNLSVMFDSSLMNLMFNAEVGRVGYQVSPYILKRVDPNPYFKNERWNNGNWNFDGAVVKLKTGGKANIDIFGGRLLAYDMDPDDDQPLQPMVAGADGNPFIPGVHYRPYGFAYTNDPGYQGYGGSLWIDRMLGVNVNMPVMSGGNLNLAYLWLRGNDTAWTYDDYEVDGVNVFGGDVKFNAGGWNVSGGYSQTDLVYESHNVIDSDNYAYWANVSHNFAQFGLDLGYRYIAPQFRAPGDWGRIGMWWNPSDIKGFTAKANVKLSDNISLDASGEFYTGTGKTLNGYLGLSTDDDITRYVIELTDTLNASNTISLGYENVTWSLIDRANQFTSNGDVEERWYNIKFNHKMGANATFSLWWQISDYDSKGNWGFWAPWGSNTAKGGLISTQVSVKFNS